MILSTISCAYWPILCILGNVLPVLILRMSYKLFTLYTSLLDVWRTILCSHYVSCLFIFKVVCSSRSGARSCAHIHTCMFSFSIPLSPSSFLLPPPLLICVCVIYMFYFRHQESSTEQSNLYLYVTHILEQKGGSTHVV